MRAVTAGCVLGFSLLVSSCSGTDIPAPNRGAGNSDRANASAPSGSCALRIGFDGQTYVGAGNEVEDGVRGKRIGTGTMQPCAGVGGGEALPETEVAIFAVEGVDPADEVIAAGWGTLVPYRSDLPDEDTP